jgi:hypothetical protein
VMRGTLDERISEIFTEPLEQVDSAGVTAACFSSPTQPMSHPPTTIDPRRLRIIALWKYPTQLRGRFKCLFQLRIFR